MRKYDKFNMKKLLIILVLVVFITSCVTIDVAPVTTAEQAFKEYKTALKLNRKSEIYYYLSYKIRDEVSYKIFVENWDVIKKNLEQAFESKVLVVSDTNVESNLQAKVFSLKNEDISRKFLLVAEFDKKRFEGEERAIWRIRGFVEKDEKLLFGIFPGE